MVERLELEAVVEPCAAVYASIFSEAARLKELAAPLVAGLKVMAEEFSAS